MVTPKAKYTGPLKHGTLEFSDSLRHFLETSYDPLAVAPGRQASPGADTTQNQTDDPYDFDRKLREMGATFGCSAEFSAGDSSDFHDQRQVFANAVLAEARFGLATLANHLHEDLTNAELRAAHDDLADVLGDATKKLRSLPPALSRHLGVAADPLGTADKIGELLALVELSSVRIQAYGRKESRQVAIDEILTEMTVRVLRVLSANGIKPSATADLDIGAESTAVSILKAIGDDISVQLSAIGLEYRPQGSRNWRERIIKARGREFKGAEP